LRLCTAAENYRNIDHGYRRWYGLGELLEQGTQKTPHGTYTVK
jgi:hypothetical protein